MSTYKRLVILNILNDLYPDTPIACGTTYKSIILYKKQSLVPEETITSRYPDYLQQHNLSILRKIRIQKLALSDKYVLPDYPFSDDAIKQAWLAYRQSLRDITTTYPNPDTDINDDLIGVVWPIPPTSAPSSATTSAPTSATTSPATAV